MKFTPHIYKAIDMAARLHDGQIRKGNRLPYIVHPFSVALILMEYTSDEDILIAGILHDTIEDTSYTKTQIQEDFGPRVTKLVCEVTEPSKSFSWQQRKDTYLDHLTTASFEAKLICAADKLHNLRSMFSAVQQHGIEAYTNFNAPIDKIFWFYEECLNILKKDKKLPSMLLDSIECAVVSLKNIS